MTSLISFQQQGGYFDLLNNSAINMLCNMEKFNYKFGSC